jgi:hypothetical protein
MTELDLNLGELHLRITLLKRQIEELNQPYLDWLVCDVAVSVPGFSGLIRWFVMPSELERFAMHLSKMNAEFPNISKLVFESIEPNVALEFELTRTNQIRGQYTIRPDLAGDTRLIGVFHIDQSYLPEISISIHAFLKASTNQGRDRPG